MTTDAPSAPATTPLPGSARLSGLLLVWTLTLRQFSPRNPREGLKIFWAIAEPVGQMTVLLLLFTLIGRAAAYGRSFALFLLTGVVMLTLFTSTTQLVKGAVLGLSAPGRLATLGMFHDALARMLFQLIVTILFTALMMWGIGIVDDVDTRPQEPLLCAAAFLLAAIMGFGVGALRGYCALFVPMVERLYAIVIGRGLIFVSGVFYVPSFMPPPLRDALAWNPLLHAVELMRMGVYGLYPDLVFNDRYLFGFALGALALGVVLLWRQRARVMG